MDRKFRSVRIIGRPPFKQFICVLEFVQHDDMGTESSYMNDVAYGLIVGKCTEKVV